MIDYVTLPQASTVAAATIGEGPRVIMPTDWWVRRHTVRGPQRAHAVPTRVLLAYTPGAAPGFDGTARPRAACGVRLAVLDLDRLELTAEGPGALRTDWTTCPDCRAALAEGPTAADRAAAAGPSGRS